MNLRPELLPPIVDHQRLAEISEEIERIADLVHQGRRSETDDAVAGFNARTGHTYAVFDFAEYQASRDLATFALEAARPARPRVSDITRPELVEIVTRIMAGDPETDYYLLLLEANVVHPSVSNLIFHPPAELQDASAETIVDTALSYRPIAL